MRLVSVIVIALSAVALILNIVGLAIPYWEYTVTRYASYYYGLWRGCATIKHYEVCSNLDAVDSVHVTTSMEFVRAFIILGALGLFSSLVARYVVQHSGRHRQVKFKGDEVLAIVSGLLIIIATIIFGSKTQYEAVDGALNFELHVGFVICVIAGALAITSGTLRIFLENKVESNRQRNRRAQSGSPVLQPMYGYATPYRPSFIALPAYQPSAMAVPTRQPYAVAPQPTAPRASSLVSNNSAGSCTRNGLNSASEGSNVQSRRSSSATVVQNGQSETTTALPLCNLNLVDNSADHP